MESVQAGKSQKEVRSLLLSDPPSRLTLLTLARSGKDKDSVNSRAYITFKTPEALVAFHKGYEGWAFRDKSGACRPSLVHSSMCSPYQAADC